MAHVLQVDPKRRIGKNTRKTGLFTTITDTDGKPRMVDVALLDRDSLHAWLRSQGGENLFAENTVMILLNHHQIVPEVPA